MGILSYSIKVDSSCSYSCSLFCTRLCQFIKSEIMDGFWSSRCLNDPVDLPDKIGYFLSGAATSMVVKNGTKKNFSHFSCTLLQIFAGILSLGLKSEINDGFWSSRCLNDPVDLPDKIGSFLSGAATSMVVKNGTKKNFSPINKKN